MLDYLHEVEHAADRLACLERAMDSVVADAPARMRAVIEALQALRGIARITAVTLVAEVGAVLALCHAAPINGIQRRRPERRFQR